MAQAQGTWVVLGWTDGERDAQALSHADRWADADNARTMIIRGGYSDRITIDVTEQWLRLAK